MLYNNIFKIEVAARMHTDFFLSSKKNAAIGSISSTLKYPVLLVFFDFQLSKILLPD